MKSAARAKPGKKREVITISDDESPNVQPAEKIVRKENAGMEVPIPSPISTTSTISTPSTNVAELQQKLEKQEKMFQKACRVAREAELRAQRAESLLDSKQGIVKGVPNKEPGKDELEKKLAMVSEELKISKAETESIRKKTSDLMKENVLLKEVVNGKKRRLEAERQYSIVKEEVNVMRMKDDESQKKISELELLNAVLTEEVKRMKKGSDGICKAAYVNRCESERQILVLQKELKEMRENEEIAKAIKADQNEIFKEQLKAVGDELSDANKKATELEKQNLALNKEINRRVKDKVLGSKSGDLEKQNKELRQLLLNQGNGASNIAVPNALTNVTDQLEQQKRETVSLKSQLDKLRAQSNEERRRDCVRIDELSAKLSSYEKWAAQSMIAPPPAPLLLRVNHFPPGDVPPPSSQHRIFLPNQ